MSQHHERKEKNCLNCNAEVAGRFCQVCGQENIEPKESFWVLATHFIHDLTHFDGKFFSTLKYLLFKPAYLSQEYLRGKRTSYLHPIRMYVFTSFIFFLIFTNFYQNKESITEVKTPVAKEIGKLEKKRDKLKIAISKKDSTLDVEDSIDRQKNYLQLIRDIELLKKDSTKRDSILSLDEDASNSFHFNNTDTSKITLKHYDSVQNSLPPNKRDNFFVRNIQRKNYALELKYDYDRKKMNEAIMEKFLHLVPQMLFVSMPLFALILQLLYVRRRQIYYVNHVVFTIHLYCATFILTLAALILNSIFKLVHLPGWVFGSIAYFIVCFYWYKAFRNFYGQSRKKTTLKYVIILVVNFFLLAILFLAFFLLSFFEM